MNNWLEDRKEIFIKNLMEGYLENRAIFNEISQHYKKYGSIAYYLLDYWVGSENKKGPLWELKDTSHKLFRNQNVKLNLVEYIFDWTLGSIFHEAMKLKEDTYQLEAYQPDKEKIKEANNDTNVDMILEEYNHIILNAQNNLKNEIENIKYLFSKSDTLLYSLLPHYSNNGLLLRFLLQNFNRTQEILGNETPVRIFKAMYGDSWEKAFIIAAKSYLEGGWYEEAKKILEMGMKFFPFSQEIEDSLIKLQIGGMGRS